jgi:hypothetical protein
MSEVVTISPTTTQQELIPYECPNCGYLMSLLQPAFHREQD